MILENLIVEIFNDIKLSKTKHLKTSTEVLDITYTIYDLMIIQNLIIKKLESFMSDLYLERKLWKK
jgi:hypothetical protein